MIIIAKYLLILKRCIHIWLTSARGQSTSLLPTPSSGAAWNVPASVLLFLSRLKTYAGQLDPWFPTSQKPEPDSRTNTGEQKGHHSVAKRSSPQQATTNFNIIWVSLQCSLLLTSCAYTLNVPSEKLLNFFSCAVRPNHMFTRSCTGIFRPLFLSIGYWKQVYI